MIFSSFPLNKVQNEKTCQKIKITQPLLINIFCLKMQYDDYRNESFMLVICGLGLIELEIISFGGVAD